MKTSLTAMAVLVLAANASGEVTVFPAPAGLKPSTRYAVRADGKDVFVHEFPNPEFPDAPLHVAVFDFSGKVELEVSRLGAGEPKAVAVRPLRLAAKPRLTGRTAAFSLSKPANLCVEFDDDWKAGLMLFSNPPETDAPKPGTAKLRYFGPGLHDCKGEHYDIPDGGAVYLAGGAVVRGLKIHYKGVDGGRVFGRGILTSNITEPKYPEPLHGSQLWCGGQGLEIRDVVLVRNTPGWQNAHFHARKLTLRNFRSVGHNTVDDGLDLVDCRGVVLDNVFIRAGDDCVAIKNYKDVNDYGPGGDAGDIAIRNSVFFNGLFGNALEIGVETCGGSLRNITVENCDIVQSYDPAKEPATPQYAALGIHVAGDTAVSDVRFEGIRIERDAGGQILADIRLYKHEYSFGRPRGSISGIVLKDIEYLGGQNPAIHIQGADADHAVSDVLLDNVRIGGKVAADPAEARMVMPAHVRNVRFGAAPAVAWSSPAGWRIMASDNDRMSHYMIDGRPETLWTTEGPHEKVEWVALDLGAGPGGGKAASFDRVRIRTGWWSLPAGYRVSVSDDGKTWSDPVPHRKQDEKGPDGAVAGATLVFAEQTKRFLRVEGLPPKANPGSKPNPWQIQEIGVFHGDRPIDLSFGPVSAPVGR